MKKFKLLLLLSFLGGGVYAEDSIAFHDPAEYLSGELPILYINTDSCKEVTSKEYYITGSYYLDANGVEGYESIGSADKPLALQIKGRGNTTWRYAKKPFRLKLDKKAALLGMTKSKHFVLLNHIDNKYAMFQDEMGFELSRRIGLEYTPRQLPLELVFNGDYRGLYMLAEKIRVDSDHVNIVEQNDEETDPELVTGGWLMEIDNFDDDAQIRMHEKNGGWLRFTYHSPEVLSTVQYNYLYNLCSNFNNVVYSKDKSISDLEDLVDLDALARFYLVNEILGNVESFVGSCYWHKDRGNDAKIVFGPVWDFGASFSYSHAMANDDFLFKVTPANHFIGDLMKFPCFLEKVQQIWNEERDNLYDGLDTYLDNWCNNISNAGKSDLRRWGGGWNNNVLYYKNVYMNMILQKAGFLDTAIPNLILLNKYDVNKDGIASISDLTTIICAIEGPNEYRNNCDIDKDGDVTVADLTLEINYLMSE